MLSLVSALACGSDGSSTGITLTISILSRDFVIDELRVRAEVEGLEPTEVRRALETPAGDSETVNLLFDADAGGRNLEIIVEAFSGGASVLTGRTTRKLERDKFVTAEVRLASCAASDGAFCDADTLVACDPSGSQTVRTSCSYGCNGEARRCNACAPSTVDCQGDSFVTCGEDGMPLFTDDCNDASEPCRTGTCTPNGCVTAPARQGQTFCFDGQISTTCDDAGNAINFICVFGCNLTRDLCNECDPSPAKAITCRADIESLCNAQVVCDSDGRVLAKTCCSSNQCTCDGTQCLEDTCSTAPDVGVGGTFSGDLCTGADNVPGDCFPGGVACRGIAAGGQPEKLYRLTLDDQNNRSTFYNVVLDSSGSAAATDLRVSTVCGNESLQIPTAQVCALPAGAAALRACIQDDGADVLLLCGLPEGDYFGAVDVEAGSCSSCPCSYDLDVTITPVTLDTAAQAGNISRGGTFRGNTCSLGDQFTFPSTSSVSGCDGIANCAAGVCPACSAGAATDCRVSPADSLCAHSGVGGADAVFYLALPVDSGVDISTAGSLFDTVLYILESGPSGASPPGAVRVCNDDCLGADGASHIQTSLAAGLYYVVLDGAAGDCGDFVLSVQVSPSATCPNLSCELPFENCQTCPGDCRCQRCGDGVVQGEDGELCDDGNPSDGDGCNASCVVEAGYKCAGAPSVCARACGDGVVDFDRNERCDDYNNVGLDGCSATCTVEAGSICTGSPSVCA
ncbi:MAG TPA: hypothetical protein VLC93_12440, partial [Myxococcota bacterium]|nr:hypothetical protein [Myxococcota bacterium]